MGSDTLISVSRYNNKLGRTVHPCLMALCLLGLTMMTASLPAAGRADSIEAKTKVHRLNSSKRAPFDAFVYVNRIPKAAGELESPIDFAGRIFGRLANQEGRILLKLPPGMDRSAYLGFKTFLGSEGNAQVNNCVSCHAAAEFTDGKSHVVSPGGSARPTPTLRNLKQRKVDLRKIVEEKITASRLKKSGKAPEIDESYARMNIGAADVDNLVAFLNSLNDVADGDFRNLIIEAKLLDTSQDIESPPSVSGLVRFEGRQPKRKPLAMTPESSSLYPQTPLDENVLIDPKGGLANAFVYVKRGVEKKDYPLPEEPALVNQDKSMFRPRVQGLRVGQTLIMRNSDPFIHNVRSLSLKNRAFNIGQPPRSADRTRVFKKAEGPIRLGCDFHKWMAAYIFVMDHPFYTVSDEQGRFTIEGLPPGEYTLEAWHEEFGKQRIDLSLGSSGSAQVNFTFKPTEN